VGTQLLHDTTRGTKDRVRSFDQCCLLSDFRSHSYGKRVLRPGASKGFHAARLSPSEAGFLHRWVSHSRERERERKKGRFTDFVPNKDKKRYIDIE